MYVSGKFEFKFSLVKSHLQKSPKNYTKSFGIKIINKNDQLIQLNSSIDSVASLLKKKLNEMKGIKHIETLKLTFKKTTVDTDKSNRWEKPGIGQFLRGSLP